MSTIEHASKPTAGPGTGPVDASQVGPTRRTRRRLGAAVVGMVLLVSGIWWLGPAGDGLPYDPRSTDPSGLHGLVTLLGEFDVDVTLATSPPNDLSTIVFVAVDQFGADRRADLESFASAGGTVVIADATSPVHGFLPVEAGLADFVGRTTRAPDCDLLPEVDAVRHAGWAGLGLTDDQDSDEVVSCFAGAADGGDAWLRVRPEGEGTIVALGSPEAFTNRALADEDNAVLALSLLGAEPGGRVAILPRAMVGEGETPLLELIPDRVFDALWLLLAAIVTAVLWRARRLGPPVEERLPPVLPSAELARSVGSLWHRAGDRAAVAGRLREDIRRDVRRTLRVPMDTGPEQLVPLVVARTGTADEDAERALLHAPVATDGDLVDLGAAIGRVRERLAHPTPPAVERTPTT
jgi:hypothetical protein